MYMYIYKKGDVCSCLHVRSFLQIYHSYDTSESARNIMAHVTPVLTTAGLVNTGFNPGTVIVITWSNMFGKASEGCADVFNNQVKLPSNL